MAGRCLRRIRFYSPIAWMREFAVLTDNSYLTFPQLCCPIDTDNSEVPCDCCISRPDTQPQVIGFISLPKTPHFAVRIDICRPNCQICLGYFRQHTPCSQSCPER